MTPDFDSMNETDVREVIVRPLLHRLGYAHGTQANIRTEVTLRYDRAFLGRKKPNRDPSLVGRADYICEAVSYGRWTVEVKSPSVCIGRDDVEQAHTYAAHPEVNAVYFMITNGREFRVYLTSNIDRAVIEWRFDEIESKLLNIFNLLSFSSIKKRYSVLSVDRDRPLGYGLPSRLRIMGGHVKYGDHESDHPLLKGDSIKGLKGIVTSGSVARDSDGRIKASVAILSPIQTLMELNRLCGLEIFDFFASDEHASRDIEHPTVFQNVSSGNVPPGQEVTLTPGFPPIRLPIGFQFSAVSNAVGFVDEDETFRGIVDFEYEYQFIRGRISDSSPLGPALSRMPMLAKVKGSGEFEIILREWR